jgi:deoxyadenosine/deoxycytidine kinase
MRLEYTDRRSAVAMAAPANTEVLRQLAVLATVATLASERGSAASTTTTRPYPGALIYVIEGEIGAGKTELAKAIAAKIESKGLRVCLILEPVEVWRSVGILGRFYQDPARFGYSFQTYVYATRVLAIAKAVQDNPSAHVYLLERSPATDHIFLELQRELVDPVEMAMYYTWCKTYDLLLPIDLKSARVLYLRTSLHVCMSRLSNRNRAGEIAENGQTKHDGSATGGVSIEYQQRLRRAHEQFLRLVEPSGEFPHLPEAPFGKAAVIDIESAVADRDFRESGSDQNMVIDAIISLMGLGDILK